MQLETQTDLLLEIPVQHLPTIRWFKNNWMDLVFEINAKGDCVEFSISYSEMEDHFNIEWHGSQVFFSQNDNTLEQTEKVIQEAQYLLQNHGAKVPADFIEFILTRLSAASSL